MSSLPAPSAAHTLTDRQKRESNYYNEFSRINAPEKVDFSPVLSPQKRPWSPYWYVCSLARNAYTNPGQRLLDFGCGMGVAGVTFARLGYQVDGFDISPGNIAVAQHLASRHGLAKRCRFTTMTAEYLKYPNDHFDVIVGTDILHHVEIQPVLKEVHRVLKPGGIAIFKEPTRIPILDDVREFKLMQTIAPRHTSFDKHVHITHDERKLTTNDVKLIKQSFDHVHIQRFSLLLRLYRVIPNRWFNLVWKFQRLDYEMMRRFPPIRRFGDVSVFLCKKQISCDHRSYQS